MGKLTWDAVLASFEDVLRKKRVRERTVRRQVKEATEFVAFLKKAEPSRLTTRHMDRYYEHLQEGVEQKFQIVIEFIAHVTERLRSA